MRTAAHGMPRIGRHRELKWALEDYWAGRADRDRLLDVAAGIRSDNWRTVSAAGVDFVASNDFSLYDHVLDAAAALGALPERFDVVGPPGSLKRYFAMARGGEVDGVAVAPLELTKWFDTNYHQLVPEIGPDTVFAADPSKALGELEEARVLGVETTPVLLGPLTFLLRSVPTARAFSPLSLLDRVGEAFHELLAPFDAAGVAWVRLDEPALVEDRSAEELDRSSPYASETVVSTSCWLLHVPMSLETETAIDPEVRPWLAFAEEKLGELAVLAEGAEHGPARIAEALEANRAVRAARQVSKRVHDRAVRRAVAEAPVDPRRSASPAERAAAQAGRLALPTLPTTTIGSFPQTAELRAVRASWRADGTSEEEYHRALRREIDRVVTLQEDLGLDVLVHGEPERDDMVRYFAASLSGFTLPESGWVQSYGSRCVRPPILFGDVARPEPLTVTWTTYAATRTAKPMKAMLTGPATMVSWSFVRDDLPRGDVAAQLGLALAEEVADLQCAGTAVVQIDEPALREGLPLRHEGRVEYLGWATRAFRLASSAAVAATQVHTHMCYAEVSDVVDVLADLDVDVASFEAARSAMTLLGTLGDAAYRGGVGPGAYDVHSPHVPTEDEIASLLRRAVVAVGPERLWVNPDCGLKTRSYAEVTAALAIMVAATRQVRAELTDEARLRGRT